jgi:hypothetical protein
MRTEIEALRADLAASTQLASRFEHTIAGLRSEIARLRAKDSPASIALARPTATQRSVRTTRGDSRSAAVSNRSKSKRPA